MNAIEIIEQYKQGRRDYLGVDAHEEDFSEAVLPGIDFGAANLTWCDFTNADLSGAILDCADLRCAELGGAKLCDAELNTANLRGATLSGADLRGADIEFGAWPLSYGTRGVIIDREIAAHLVASICTAICDDPDFQTLREQMLPFARTSRHADGFGLLEVKG